MLGHLDLCPASFPLSFAKTEKSCKKIVLSKVTSISIKKYIFLLRQLRVKVKDEARILLALKYQSHADCGGDTFCLLGDPTKKKLSSFRNYIRKILGPSQPLPNWHIAVSEKSPKSHEHLVFDETNPEGRHFPGIERSADFSLLLNLLHNLLYDSWLHKQRPWIFITYFATKRTAKSQKSIEDWMKE